MEKDLERKGVGREGFKRLGGAEGSVLNPALWSILNTFAILLIVHSALHGQT